MTQPSRISVLVTNDASLKTGLNSWRMRCKHGNMIHIGELLSLPRLVPCAWTRFSPTLGHCLTQTLYLHMIIPTCERPDRGLRETRIAAAVCLYGHCSAGRPARVSSNG